MTLSDPNLKIPNKMAASLKLFHTFEREYMGPSEFSESNYHYLNRSARPEFACIRQILQLWFDNYNAREDKRFEMYKLLRSDLDEDHLTAFFELYLYQLFTRLGFTVVVEPEWPVNSPDFLLSLPTGEEILLEATSVFTELDFGVARKRENKVLDEINKRLKFPEYFLHMQLNGGPTGEPPYGKICKFLRKELSKLDPIQVERAAVETQNKGFDRLPRIPWQHDSWDIEFFVIPVKPEARGKSNHRIIGSRSYGFFNSDLHHSLKSKIRSKASRYGELHIPYIVAINFLSSFLDDDDVLDALFGKEQLIISIDTDETDLQRKLDGMWMGVSDGKVIGKNKRMSGLLLFKNLYPHTVHVSNPILWHHPYAYYPLNLDQWAFGQKALNKNTGRYEYVQGTFIDEILGVDTKKLP